MKKRVVASFIVILIIFSISFVDAKEARTFEDLLNSFVKIFNFEITGKATGTEPTISITYPSNNANITTLSITATGGSTNTNYVQVRLNNGAWQNVNGLNPWNTNLNLITGSNLIEAKSCAATCSGIRSINVNYYECINECSLNGIKQCSGNGYQTCGNYDQDFCLELNSVTQCLSNEICSNGECVNSCTSECNLGEKVCSNNGYKVCEEVSLNCYKYSNVIECSQNEVCIEGSCVSQVIPEDKCQDNTFYNKCSLTKPLYCEEGELINDCETCGCPGNKFCSPSGNCIDEIEELGEDEEISLINHAPIVSFIEIELGNDEILSLDLNEYVLDEDDDEISIKFNDNNLIYTSEIIDCNLEDKFLECDNPKKSNIKEILKLIASDGIEEREFSIELEIINKESGTPPVADSGKDIKAYVNSIIILDGSKSYDIDNDLSKDKKNYIWYEDNKEIGRGVSLNLKYDKTGEHKITLKVTDSSGLSSEDKIEIDIMDKEKCRNTNTIYFPEDTICNNKWPYIQGSLIKINSEDYACNLFEVCDDSIDYIIEDAINCCAGITLNDTKKINVCNFAVRYSNTNPKKCQGLYLIKSLGGNQIYMQDYFTAEMCCSGYSQLCPDSKNLYKAKPKPNTEVNLKGLKCYNTKENDARIGKWVSDTDMSKNNIALFDAPAHVSLNILSTGTCNDYSIALTTLLRKIGYAQNQVYTVTTSNHAYNLIKLPLDKKYTIADTTGNNEPPIVLGSVPQGYPYCESIKFCYNDNGQVKCPELNKINGCEGLRKTGDKYDPLAEWRKYFE